LFDGRHCWHRGSPAELRKRLILKGGRHDGGVERRDLRRVNEEYFGERGPLRAGTDRNQWNGLG